MNVTDLIVFRSIWFLRSRLSFISMRSLVDVANRRSGLWVGRGDRCLVLGT
ncbi:MAG: hypothetical protein ACK5C9_05275 [Pseudanabaena sp.]